MSCLSQFFILTQRGNPIIRKEFRGDLPMTTTETFYHNVKFFNGEQQAAPPIFLNDGITYLYVKNNGLYFVATTKHCISPSFIMELLTKIIKIFNDYLGILTEKTIKQNFILLYELLDEVLDFGYVQSISTELLKEFVFNPPLKTTKTKMKLLPLKHKKTQNEAAVQRPVWFGGPPKSKKEKNEIFVDILEKVSVVFNNNGHHLSSSINGNIKMKSYLCGNPPLVLALNHDLLVDDINFHEIVKLKQYESDKVLTFIPPDGEFDLLNYRVTNRCNPPIKIFPKIQLISPYKSELILKITSDNIPHTNYGNVCVEVSIFINCQTVTTELETNVFGQSAEFNRMNKKVLWKIEKFIGGSEQSLKIKITFKEQKTIGIKKQIGPISMSFKIPMYNVSNLQIKYLRSEQTVKHSLYRWIRYVTQSESYICRL